MPNAPYHEFAEKWKTKIEVDYFTEFLKTWIAFNAWYKMTYQSLTRDRDAINEIKNAPNSFRNRIMVLLANSQNDENIRFKNHIGLLHRELERKHIHNNNERISCERIKIGNNPNTFSDGNRNGLYYRVERTYNGSALRSVDSTISKNSNSFFTHTQTIYDFEPIKSLPLFISLSATQKTNLEYFYGEIDPKRPVNLISRTVTEMKMGEYHFIEATDTIAKALIELLYLIRNSLFHGSIIPDRETNKIYEQAYQILKLLVQDL